MSQHTSASFQQQVTRLPCRGCLPDCPNYQSCDGKPWRADKMPAASSGKPQVGA